MPNRTPDPRPRLLLSPFASDRVLRRTFLWGFADPADAEALERFGLLLFTLAVEGNAWGRTTRGRSWAGAQLAAAAEDLALLARFLEQLASAPAGATPPAEERDPRRAAGEWAKHVGRAVQGLRKAAGEPQAAPPDATRAAGGGPHP